MNLCSGQATRLDLSAIHANAPSALALAPHAAGHGRREHGARRGADGARARSGRVGAARLLLGAPTISLGRNQTARGRYDLDRDSRRSGSTSCAGPPAGARSCTIARSPTASPRPSTARATWRVLPPDQRAAVDALESLGVQRSRGRAPATRGVAPGHVALLRRAGGGRAHRWTAASSRAARSGGPTARCCSTARFSSRTIRACSPTLTTGAQRADSRAGDAGRGARPRAVGRGGGATRWRACGPAARGSGRRRSWRSTTNSVPERRPSSSDTWMMPGPGGADADVSSAARCATPRSCTSDMRSLVLLIRRRRRSSGGAVRSKDRRFRRRAIGGTIIIAAPASRVELFPPFVDDQIGAARPGSGLRPARRDQRRSRHGRRQGLHAAARAEVDVVAGFAVDRLLARSARAVARRQAGDGERRALQLQALHRSQGRLADRAAAQQHRLGLGARFAHARSPGSRSDTPEQFYDLAYQLLIMPEHVYGSIPPEQLHTSDGDAHADRQRRVSVRALGAGRAHRARRRHGELSRPAEARPRDLHRRVDPPARRRSCSPARRTSWRRFPLDQVAEARQQHRRARDRRAAARLRVPGDEPARRQVEDRAASDLRRHSRAPRAVDGGRSRRRCCRTCSARWAAWRTARFR